MNTEQFTALHSELVRIREALESRPVAAAPAAAAPAKAAYKAISNEVPMPTEVIANAGEVEVHFGKNKGVRIGTLAEKSLLWYAQDPEPRMNSQGEPFPPRIEDTRLRNAVRTLIHQRRGTIPDMSPVLKPDLAPDEVPF